MVCDRMFWEQHPRWRWIKPNAHLWLRENAHLYRKPAPFDREAWLKERNEAVQKSAESYSLALTPEDITEYRAGIARIRAEVAALRLFLRLRRKAGFDPNQPRVPAGNPDGGQWTDGSGSATNRVRLASSGKPRLGPAALAALAAQVAKRLIEAYRSDNFLFDLFGRKEGTVAVTTLDGVDIFGSNSRSPTYTAIDRFTAEQMRDVLIEKYPDVMQADDIGQKPNDALFHAEATALLRAARKNGGTLEGRSIEIHADRELCPSCEKVLPLIGSELGNPTVTFVGPQGNRRMMRGGRWIDEVR